LRLASDHAHDGGMIRAFLALAAVISVLLAPLEWGRHAPIVASSETRVVVEVAAAPAGRGPDAAARQRIAEAQDAVLARAGSADVRLERRFDALPAFVATVSDDGLRQLKGDPGVRSLTPDRDIHLELLESARLIRADDVRLALGETGAGITVAVIDTGIDTDHPDIAGDVAFEECFMLSGCPLGGAHVSGPGSAEDDHGHGTRVSGVITSTGTVAPPGIAPDAMIGAYKVVSSTGSGSFSDVLASFNDIIANHPEVRAVNVSLSNATNHGASCDTLDPVMATAINTLTASNTLVFIASGNDGFTTGLPYPACMSSAVATGTVWDDTGTTGMFTPACTEVPVIDKPACYSNSASSLDLLAPGGMTTTTTMGGGTMTTLGTSIATPHAVGAAAVLWSMDGSLTAAQVEAALKTTGVPRTDPKSGVTTPRIDLWAAVASLIADPDGDGLSGPVDNCPTVNNPLQENTDRNFIDQTPPSTQDDRTVARTDRVGDACDTDDDNDALSDTAEAAGCNGSGPLDPTNPDTDSDRFLDGPECTLGTNPAGSGSKPLLASCAASGDADGDKVQDRVEVCHYNTRSTAMDTDGDLDGSPSGLTRDGCEVASINGDRNVNAGDQLLLATAITTPFYLLSFDLNKDGGVNAGDQLVMSSLLSPPGQCP
jgi:subtilisin family serine protease